jgi:predicted metal-dependent hydrolase
MNIIIQRQERKTLAMVATPAGVEVRIPSNLDPEGARVRAFIAGGLARLQEHILDRPERPFTRVEAQAMIDQWAGRLAVTVGRVQFQPMRQKWGSLSSHGNLTLADDVLELPASLIEYIVVHELLHSRHPHHARHFKVALSLALPDWREREQELAAWLVTF